MADGVDHIDIYADVGEEFNQVRAARGRGLSAPLPRPPWQPRRLQGPQRGGRAAAIVRALPPAAGAGLRGAGAGAASRPGRGCGRRARLGGERAWRSHGAAARRRAPSFAPSLFRLSPAFLPLCLSSSGAAPEGSPAPARPTGPSRMRRRERPLPARGGGEALPLFAG